MAVDNLLPGIADISEAVGVFIKLNVTSGGFHPAPNILARLYAEKKSFEESEKIQAAEE